MNGTTLEAKSKIIESSWTKLNHGGDRMTIEEILAGESKNVEFKVQRPDKSMKYMKTVVAFANGKGGRIIFGIDDKTREVVGIPEDKVFREIDAITNAISDSCEPTIIPDVYLQNINDKPVIVAEIRTGRRKPYYIKAEGLENGVYIRVSGTTRPADRDMSRELYYECDARSFDSIIRRDIEVTDEDIKSLCEQMKEVAIANCKSNLQRSAVKDVTKNVLLSWGILKKDENEIVADFSYSYATPRYAFICLMKNPEISVPMSGRLVTGLTAVYNYINPAVSNFGKQVPPEGIGVEEFEFWCPKRRPESKNIAMSFAPSLASFNSENLRNSYYRPYIGTNAWVAAFDDARPEVCFKWNGRKQIKTIILYFDTDTDQAMETVQMGHFDACVPTCYREYIIRNSEGKELYHITGNHQTLNVLELDQPVTTDAIYVNFVRPCGDVCPGLMGVYVC